MHKTTSILKMVNGANNDWLYLMDLFLYITDNVKTEHKKWVGASGCSKEHPIDDMLSIKKLYHKMGGKQGEHIVLSPFPDYGYVKNEVYMDVAREIAMIYDYYQCFYALHLDSNRRHIHFVLNSVAYTDGLKFQQSPSNLNRTKTRVNEILDKYDFELIRTSASDLYDTTDHSKEIDFDYLEVDPARPYQTRATGCFSHYPVGNYGFSVSPYPNPYYERREIPMNPQYTNTNRNYGISLPNQNGQIIMPVTNDLQTPGLTLRPETHLIINGTPDNDALRQTIMQQHYANNQMAAATYAQLRQSGINDSVCINPVVKVEINLPDHQQETVSNNAIETSFDSQK